MSKNHVFVVDGNSIAHANHSANVLTVGGMQTQAIFGFLRSMRVLLQSCPIPNSKVVILWDSRADFRYELFPGYKGNRVAKTPEEQANKDAFKRQSPFIEKAMTMLGVSQLRAQGLEADDLAGHLVPKLASAGNMVTMVSGDKDWIQAVGKDVLWFDPIRDRRCNGHNFLDFTGYFTPKAFVQGKALTGDSSDGVPHLPGFSGKAAPVFLARWKDVNEFFKAVDAGVYTPVARLSKNSKTLHPEQHLASPEGRAAFELNMKLMDWKLSPKPTELINTPGAVNVEGFTILCERLAFASILRDMEMFLKAFNINKESL